jgi:arylsulfatase A-like enzyme
VVYVSIDTLRADHLDAYGYERATAPNLARLAAEGALFEQCIAVANWTLPTHTTLFTGLHPLVHGVEEHGDRLADDIQTLGEVFADAGYATAGWYSNPFVGEQFGFIDGFDTYAMATSGAERAANIEKRGTPRGSITGSHQPVPGPREEDYFVEQSAEPVTEHALAFLDARDQTKPFFFFLHYNDVHSDYIPPAPYDQMFDPDYGGTLTAERYPHNERIRRDMPAEDLEHVIALYDGEIAWVDHQFGRVLDRLDELGLADDTVVVVTADHGEGFFEHGKKEHHYGLYEELVHIPFLVRHPARVAPGQWIDSLVSQADIPVTLLELAGLSELDAADGRSWAPFLRGEGRAPPERPVVSSAVLKPMVNEEGEVVLSLRTSNYTAIRQQGTDGKSTVVLFDRPDDPNEQRPLNAEHAYREHARKLMQSIEAILEEKRNALGAAASAEGADPELLEKMRQWGYIRLASSTRVCRPTDSEHLQVC